MLLCGWAMVKNELLTWLIHELYDCIKVMTNHHKIHMNEFKYEHTWKYLYTSMHVTLLQPRHPLLTGITICTVQSICALDYHPKLKLQHTYKSQNNGIVVMLKASLLLMLEHIVQLCFWWASQTFCINGIPHGVRANITDVTQACCTEDTKLFV